MSDREPGWQEARMATFTSEVDERTARAWLPPGLLGLRIAKPARATLFIADYPRTSFGISYREAGLFLHARCWGREVLHCAWMVVDDDVALILGRELLGFPKKIAEISLTLENGNCQGVVRRGGAELITISGKGGQPTLEHPAFPLPIVNVWGIPALLPRMLLWMNPPQRVHDGWHCEMTVDVGGSDSDPLDRLGIGKRVIVGTALITDLAVPPERPEILPRGFPAGLVSPRWFLSRYPFRVW